MYLDVIWWIKNSKPFETVNFTRTSEISDCILNTLWYSPEVGTRVDFLKLEFSILNVWPANSFWKVFRYIQNFCHGDFFISFVKIKEIVFWTGVAIFQTLLQIQFSSEIDWLDFHTKSDSSLRLIKNILFYLSYDLTLFSSLLLSIYLTLLQCILMLYDG